MKKLRLLFVPLCMAAAFSVFAIDISGGGSARLDITSRTSFGLDLDNPYRYGLSNELTQLDLIFNLTPYQKITNRVNSPEAVGFIDLTLFHLDLIYGDTSLGYHAPGSKPLYTNRYQTGEFVAGILNKAWLIQLNAGGNEPFTSPWNKGMQFINDGFKFSWAYLDSMVDVRRSKTIAGLPVITSRGEENMDEYEGTNGTIPENQTMQQYSFDAFGLADKFGMNQRGQMVAVMYNRDSFGINLKLGTQYTYTADTITKDNRNGLAFGIDTAINPASMRDLRIYASLGMQNDWGIDKDPDPLLWGAKVGYTVNLNEEISMEPFVGLDMGTKIKNGGGAEKLEYEVSGGATMRWPGQYGWLTDYILNSEGRVFPGMSLSYKLYGNAETEAGKEHSMKFTLFEPRGDDGLFYKIGSEIIIDFLDLTDVTPDGRSLLATAYVDYEIPGIINGIGTLIPWTILYYDNVPDAADKDSRINDMKIDLGVNLENAIANTTFGVVWNTGSLIQQTQYHWGYVRVMAEIRL
ncbi:MAG: hypothetical protein LBS97_07025 [Treponema sp.]|nr:hypothetical protein [Treponema sp.]